MRRARALRSWPTRSRSWPRRLRRRPRTSRPRSRRSRRTPRCGGGDRARSWDDREGQRTQATIASAVEEQTATTNEMGRNVARRRRVGRDRGEHHRGGAGGRRTPVCGGLDQQAATELSRMAAEMESLVSRSPPVSQCSTAPARRVTRPGHPARCCASPGPPHDRPMRSRRCPGSGRVLRPAAPWPIGKQDRPGRSLLRTPHTGRKPGCVPSPADCAGCASVSVSRSSSCSAASSSPAPPTWACPPSRGPTPTRATSTRPRPAGDRRRPPHRDQRRHRLAGALPRGRRGVGVEQALGKDGYNAAGLEEAAAGTSRPSPTRTTSGDLRGEALAERGEALRPVLRRGRQAEEAGCARRGLRVPASTTA